MKSGPPRGSFHAGKNGPRRARAGVDYFNRHILLRGKRGGDDLFSQLRRAAWEDGSLLSNTNNIDHMSFLLMAAHDTVTSSLTSFVYRLANPLWQERVREEVRGLKLAADEGCLSRVSTASR